jgi:uncharacterized MAPEG superfamily protein
MSPPSYDKWNEMFKVYSICTLVLFVKYFLTTMWAIDSSLRPEEDKILPLLPVPDDIKRRQRAFLNDVENIPFHMAILWGAFIVQNYCNASGHGDNETSGLIILIIIYTAARFLHTTCYLLALQPFRSLAYMIGQGAILATCGVMISSAFKVDLSYGL